MIVGNRALQIWNLALLPQPQNSQSRMRIVVPSLHPLMFTIWVSSWTPPSLPFSTRKTSQGSGCHFLKQLLRALCNSLLFGRPIRPWIDCSILKTHAHQMLAAHHFYALFFTCFWLNSVFLGSFSFSTTKPSVPWPPQKLPDLLKDHSSSQNLRSLQISGFLPSLPTTRKLRKIEPSVWLPLCSGTLSPYTSLHLTLPSLH